MAVIPVLNLNDGVKTWLRISAAQQGIAIDEAMRRILTRAATEIEEPHQTFHNLGWLWMVLLLLYKKPSPILIFNGFD